MESGRRAGRARRIGRRIAAAGWIAFVASVSGPVAAQAQSTPRPSAATAVASDGRANESAPNRGFVERLRDDPWRFTVAPYLWLSTVQGSTSIGDLSSSFDVDYSKLFKLLGRGDLFAAMGYFAAGKGPITAFVDFTGSMAKSDVEVRRVVPTKVDVTSLFLEFALAWNLLDLGTPGQPGHVSGNLHAGFRWNRAYSRVRTDFDNVDVERSASTTQNWVDPLVGGAFTLDVAERTSLYFRGDIGGFGAGSQLAWQAMGVFDVYLGMLGTAQTDLLLGYKAYSFDYETTGTRGREIRMQETLSGPLVGLAWQF